MQVETCVLKSGILCFDKQKNKFHVLKRIKTDLVSGGTDRVTVAVFGYTRNVDCEAHLHGMVRPGTHESGKL